MMPGTNWGDTHGAHDCSTRDCSPAGSMRQHATGPNARRRRGRGCNRCRIRADRWPRRGCGWRRNRRWDRSPHWGFHLFKGLISARRPGATPIEAGGFPRRARLGGPLSLTPPRDRTVAAATASDHGSIACPERGHAEEGQPPPAAVGRSVEPSGPHRLAEESGRSAADLQPEGGRSGGHRL